MKEADLRKRHRYIGITLAFFILLQAASGVLLTVIEWAETPAAHAHSEKGHRQTPSQAAAPTGQGAVPEQTMAVEAEKPHSPVEAALGFIHHGGGPAGDIYRLLVGGGLMGMALSGSMIFFKIQARTKAASHRKGPTS